MLLLCAALAVTVGVATASSATPTTIGQTGTPSNESDWVPGIELLSDGYVVPAGGGTILSLNTQAAGPCLVTGIYNLQVLRPLGGNPTQYKVLGDTGHKTDPCDGQLHSYPVNIQVQAGDVLGVYVVDFWQGVLSGAGATFSFQSEPAVGDTVTGPGSDSGAAVDESATLAPVTKSDCMNGGWQSYGVFKNQGDCVSFVATGGKNSPAGS